MTILLAGIVVSNECKVRTGGVVNLVGIISACESVLSEVDSCFYRDSRRCHMVCFMRKVTQKDKPGRGGVGRL